MYNDLFLHIRSLEPQAARGKTGGAEAPEMRTSGKGKGQVDMLPVFGSMSSDYNSQVEPFYDAWQKFSSGLKFSDASVFDTRQASNRWERRRMEEENRKHVAKARNAYSREVRELVREVWMRDPRVLQHNLDMSRAKFQKHHNDPPCSDASAERRRGEGVRSGVSRGRAPVVVACQGGHGKLSRT